MTVARVRMEGLEQLQGKFNRFSGDLPKEMQSITKEAVIYVHGHLPKHPPAPAFSTYRRTLTLWRTLTGFVGSVPDALSRVEKLFGDVKGFIGTRLKYAPWVIDRDNQTAVHKANNWWNLQDEVVKMKEGIINVYRKGMDRFVRRNFS